MTLTRFASTAPPLTKAERDLLSQLHGNERELTEALFYELDAVLVVPHGIERARQLAALSEGEDRRGGLACRPGDFGSPSRLAIGTNSPSESADEQLRMEAA